MGARIDTGDDLWPRSEDWNSAEAPAEPAPVTRGWLPAAAAGLVATLWIAAMLWLAAPSLVGLPPVALVEFIAALCVPPILVGIVWLLVQRTSRAEARRFVDVARAMRAEAALLEQRVGGLSRTLASQREQLVTQLDAGAAAAGRLEAIGRNMALEIENADRHATALADAAERARSTVGDLLAAMPMARSESEEVGRRLDQAGLAAAAQAAALDAQVTALSDHARDAEAHTARAADALAGHIDRMDATGAAAGSRLERVTAEVAGAVDALLTRTERALGEARATLATQADDLHATLSANHATLDGAVRASADALSLRLQEVDGAIDRIDTRLVEGRSSGNLLVGDLTSGIAGVEAQLDALHAQGVDRTQVLAASISALGGSADAMTEALRNGEAMAARTIGTTETLLIALDAAAREIDETLPDALTRLDARIADSKRVVVQAKPELLALVTAAESTHDAIEAIAGVIAEQRRTLDQLSAGLLETLATGRTKADALGLMMDETIDRTQRFAEEAAPRLLDALLRVRDTAQTAADHARETLATVIPEAADTLEHATADAMRRAASDTVERQVTAIREATQAAVDAATRATERLAVQVQAIADQTAVVDTRLEDARVAREEADRDTLAHRVSLLIESLNSASIDITKAFAPDVSDSAWAAYLKGDRGVFTRRAVRLLEGGDAREIARLYDDDGRFREQVNRYIHDFEGMLRQVLAQRDGSPMGVTLLSSDMGKLYVALAQAIERLR